jgi:hypothetical protein
MRRRPDSRDNLSLEARNWARKRDAAPRRGEALIGFLVMLVAAGAAGLILALYAFGYIKP